MNTLTAAQKGEEIAELYNPHGLVPFPFEEILTANSDVELFIASLEEEFLSGVISYDSESKKFKILVNENRAQSRRYFTIAHELGHYFLHKDDLIAKTLTVDTENSSDLGGGLFRYDELLLPNEKETEANNFAASLLMPRKQVEEVWAQLSDIQLCAEVFKVSVSAMSIRLERLDLI